MLITAARHALMLLALLHASLALQPARPVWRTRAPAVTMAFETEPTFATLNVGAGIVRMQHGGTFVAAKCQFAAFGPRQFGGPAALAMAAPAEADAPLEPLSGAIAIVRRGKCSFQAKAEAATAAGGSGVILLSDDEELFLAAPDPPRPDPARPGEVLPTAAAVDQLPLVVVSSSDGAKLAAACAEADGAASVTVTPLSEDESLADALRLPLFPVAQTLLPGQLLRMAVSAGERLALQTRFKLALDGPPEGGALPEDLGVATVAVVLVGDASSNLLATTATLAHVDLETLRSKGTHVTLRGAVPCHMRCLIRESTPRTFGLALVEPYVREAAQLALRGPRSPVDPAPDPALDAGDGEARARDEVAAELRAQIGRVGAAAQRFGGVSFVEGGSAAELARMWDELPTDLSLLTFKACSLLGLGAKREQAALQCRLPERVRVLRRLLRALEDKYARAASIGSAGGAEGGGGGTAGRSFVSAAVARATPGVVVIEPLRGSGELRAAGFALHPDGLLVTNRHVANASSAVRVVFEDGGSEVATLEAESREYDIAFLRVKRRGLRTVPLGDSDRLALGDWLIALGHPAEFDNLATLGIVSAIQRPTPTGPGVSPHALLDRSATFIATDARYNKGVSGGPLLNERGEAVGMNTFLLREEGLGFAIAVGRIRDAALELLGVEL